MPKLASLRTLFSRHAVSLLTLSMLVATSSLSTPLQAADTGSTGEASPTASADTLPPTTLGVALHTYISGNQVTFDYVVSNLGDDEITGITLEHPLNAVFGSGNYSIRSQPTLLEGSDTLTLSGQFFGFNIFAKIVTDGSLAPGASARFRTVVAVTTPSDQGNGFGVYQTQVTVNGTNSNSDALSDLSDYGINPDPNGDGSADGAGEDDITTINLSEARALGAALDATVNNTAITLDVYLENLGSGTLSSLALPLDLDAVFGAGNYTITSAPTFVDDPGTLTLNGAWDGSGTTALLAGGGTLATSDTAQIRLVINLDTVSDQGDGEGIYFLQTFASGTAPFGSLAIDLTDAGTDPDPNGNGNPADAGESDPVSLDFAQPAFTLADGTGNDTHGNGASINLVATFNKAVTVTGTPRIAITIGTETRYATYNAGPSDATSVVFTYNIQAGDNDADGIAVGSSIDLNGGTIQADNNGYDAILTFTAPDLSGVIVNTNAAPVDLTLSANTLDVSAAANTVIGTLATVDADPGDTHTYTLVTGDGDTANASFNLNGNELRATDPNSLSAGTTYSVRIQTDDGNGGTRAEAFLIETYDATALLTQFETYFKAHEPSSQDRFGDKIAVSGNTLVVGAPGEQSAATTINGDATDNSAANTGAAYVFVHDGSAWAFEAYLKPDNAGAGDSFGSSVAIDGDSIVIGALYEKSGANTINGDGSDNSTNSAGAAYVFVRSGTTWTQQAYLKPPFPRSVGYFGDAVAISGDLAVVGAFGDSSNATGINGDADNTLAFRSGAVHVFARSGTTWSYSTYLKPDNTGAQDEFGRAVAIDGHTIVIGASAEDSGNPADGTDNTLTSSGAAYVFTLFDGTWTQQAYLKADTPADGAQFGRSVAISGDTLIVGASNEASDAVGVNGTPTTTTLTNAGAAYIFQRAGSTWTQQAFLKSTHPAAENEFGHTVAIDGNVAVVGSPFNSSDATGINTLNDNTLSPTSGSAFIYRRTGETWSTFASIKAPNADSYDYFGKSVAVSNDTVFIGALFEASSANTINGDMANNDLAFAGAAYGYALVPNEAPTDITLNNASINQSTSASATVGTLTATDTNPGDTHTFSLVAGEGDLGNTNFAITEATLSVAGSEILAAGDYTVRIQSTDASGETFAKAFTITVVDDIYPDAPTNIALDGASDSGANGADNLTNDNTPTITGTSEPLATIYLDFEGGFIGIGAADANGDFAVTADALDDGIYPIQVYAGDQAGNNSGPSATLTITVDTTAPDAPATPSLALVDDTGVSFSDGITNRVRPALQGIASADATVAVYFNDAAVGLVTAAPSGLWTFTPDSDLAEGLTTVAAIVIDSAGNASAPSGELSVIVDTTAPVITSVNQINTTYGEPIDYTLTASGDPVSFTHTGLPDELSLDSSTGVLSLIGNLPASNRELTLIATDAAGNNGSLTLNFFVAQRPIDVSGFTAIDRVYDGTAVVQVDSSNAQFSNLVDGDDVSVDATSTFAYAKGKASVGTIGLAVSVSLTGTDAGNYYLNTPASVTATITPAPLDVTGILIPNKVYDGTTAATVDTTSADLTGVLESNDRSPPTGGELTAPNLEFHAATQPQPSGPDDVTLVTTGATATFASADVGTGIAVTVEGLELSGADAGNYELVLPAITADISPAPLTVSTEPAGRFYGDPNPELELTYTGFVNNEDESVLTGEPDLTITADRSSPVGEYVVEVELGTLAAANYSLTAANGVLSISLGHHFADTDRNYQIDLGELLRVIELYNHREGTVRTGAYRSDEETEDRYAPGDGDRIVPHTADSNGDGRISLVELTRIIQLYNVRQGDSRTGAYRPSKSSEDGFEPNTRSTDG